MYFNSIVTNSSAVEELEERKESIWLQFGPNHGGQYVPKNDLKVILDSTILFAGIGPRFQNHGKNTLIFGAESYRREFLKKMKFIKDKKTEDQDKWIAENLLPEQTLAEIIPLFPEKENKEESNEPEPLSAAL